MRTTKGKSVKSRPAVCVVGACNIDLISYVPRLPEPGETLHGSSFRMGFGGKGANQAVMAARLGARVSMVSKVGRDVFGADTLRNFRAAGIRTQHIHLTERAFSGVAPIAVDKAGRNSIIVVTGANDLLTVREVTAAAPAIRAAAVLVCQLESPLEASLAAMRIAAAAGVTVIFNPAPARARLPAELYRLSDVFCPNENETRMLTGLPVNTLGQAERAAAALRKRGCRSVILTLGERGVLLAGPDGFLHVKARRVKALDTTGAGDAFVGSLAWALGGGMELEAAVRLACEAATRSVLKPGTQSSFPTRDELGALMA